MKCSKSRVYTCPINAPKNTGPGFLVFFSCHSSIFWETKGQALLKPCTIGDPHYTSRIASLLGDAQSCWSLLGCFTLPHFHTLGTTDWRTHLGTILPVANASDAPGVATSTLHTQLVEVPGSDESPTRLVATELQMHPMMPRTVTPK